MLSRLTGAITRAGLVTFIITLPGAALYEGTIDAQFATVFVALCAGALTFVEYASAAPSLLEFRNAPPLNRIRVVALAVMVACATALFAQGSDTPLAALAATLANLFDMPVSPTSLLQNAFAGSLPAPASEALRLSTACAFTVGLCAVGAFLFNLRLRGWPGTGARFNLWTNLPTFDPVAQGDVVARLKRSAHLNLALAVMLPFFIPMALVVFGLPWGAGHLPSPASIVWVVTGWAFVPASLGMRGIALLQVAGMITEQRRAASLSGGAFAT